MEYVTTYIGLEKGDFVRCNMCGELLLVPTGEEICPFCGADGCMEWADEEQERSVPELKELGYVIVENNKTQTQ